MEAETDLEHFDQGLGVEESYGFLGFIGPGGEDVGNLIQHGLYFFGDNKFFWIPFFQEEIDIPDPEALV